MIQTRTGNSTAIGWKWRRFQADDCELGIYLHFPNIMEAARADDAVPGIIKALCQADDVGHVVWLDCPTDGPPWGNGECGEYHPEWLLDIEPQSAGVLDYSQRERFLATLEADPYWAMQLVQVFRDTAKGGQR